MIDNLGYTYMCIYFERRSIKGTVENNYMLGFGKYDVILARKREVK